jgi:hypothetical protein
MASREIRIRVPEEAYDQLQRLAASSQVAAEEYAAQLLTDDLTRTRFLDGAQEFITEHGPGFAERFGPRPAGGRAA